ncbi:MAG: hypothetical protein Ta2E_05410 [Mycoplasmoidaceae bacterium]|nr:MAG: hypothetical protein Ta2E_05410 [Mycoplasmoidaceae bacterium]
MASQRNDLIKKIAFKNKLQVKVVKNILDSLENEVENSLIHSNKFKLLNYGTFKIVEQREQNKNIPNTKKIIKIPRKKVIKFTISNKYKNLSKKIK